MINFLNKYDYLILILSTFILSILLFFPVSSDLAAFIQGGMILHNGGHLFVDYFDVKPPMVYYLFELLYSLFGKNIFLYRLFDVLYQLTFLISSIYIFRKLDFRLASIRTFLVLMPISYITVHYGNILQMESLFFLPAIWYFYFSTKKSNNNYKVLIIKGILLGIAINLKYTFGLLIAADVIISLSNNFEFKRILQNVSIQLSIALVFTTLMFSPVIINGNLGNFFDFWGYMKIYSNYPAMSFGHLLNMIKQLNSYFTDIYSILFFLLSTLAIFISQKENRTTTFNNINNLLTFVIILIITVVIERKILPYHLIRVYPFLILLTSIGFVYVLKYIKKLKILIIIVLLFISILFSPLSRAIYLSRLPYLFFSQSEKEYLKNFDDGDQKEILKKHYEVADYLNKQFDTDKILLINSAGNELIIYLKYDYIYSIPISAFYLNENATNMLKGKILSELKDAEIVITQNDDMSIYMFFNNENSYSSIQKNNLLWSYLNNNFIQDTVIEESFLIFKRKESH